MKRPAFLLLVSTLLPLHAQGADTDADPRSLIVATWGGAYAESQRQTYFSSFTRETGIRVEEALYTGGVEPLRDDRQQWDVVDMTMADHRQACAEGLLLGFDHSVLEPAPDGTPPTEDFLPGTYTPCGIGHTVFSMVLAFDTRAFPGARPWRVEHLFDPEGYPGKRALRREPDAIMEWALLSYGVPVDDLYSLLSTERGLRLAFRRLDRIRDDIHWWTDPAAPPRLLAEGEVAIASGYNGRHFNAAVVEGESIDIIWDGQVYEIETWGIPVGAEQPELAERFIAFATRTPSLIDQARYIAYGPARESAARQVGRHATAGIDMRPHMPTTPANMERAIRKDSRWYARTRERLSERFDAWLAGPDGE